MEKKLILIIILIIILVSIQYINLNNKLIYNKLNNNLNETFNINESLKKNNIIIVSDEEYYYLNFEIEDKNYIENNKNNKLLAKKYNIIKIRIK